MGAMGRTSTLAVGKLALILVNKGISMHCGILLEGIRVLAHFCRS